MRLLGFNFSKISIEKYSDRPKDLKVNTNISVPELKSLESDVFKTKEDLILAKFEYTIDYSPECAKVEFEGTAILAMEPKRAKTILKKWKAKEMTDDFKNALFNLIMMKSNVRALRLEEELNLPYHIPLPSLRLGEEKPKKKKK